MEAAKTFERESGTTPGVDLGLITDRMEIRRALQSGDVQEAIERVNALKPEASILCLAYNNISEAFIPCKALIVLPVETDYLYIQTECRRVLLSASDGFPYIRPHDLN